LQADNPAPTTVQLADATGLHEDKPPFFFLERYADAYRAELEAFLDVVAGDAAPPVTGEDGLRALALADAANVSLSTGSHVRVEGGAG
jgi:myo-inositol 2-dehydrogenase/D-chiro-inositol 1-dehydrogenase